MKAENETYMRLSNVRSIKIEVWDFSEAAAEVSKTFSLNKNSMCHG